jgi:Polyketide cyclase / dehydrase and lipid transport
MPTPVHLARSRTYPIPVEQAFAFTLPVPLDAVFSRRYGPLPPISGTLQDGQWSTPGQTRVVRTTDGGSMREELLSVDAPRSFTYVLTEVEGPLKPLAVSVDGAWEFEPVGSGCRITWSWTIHPRSAGAALVLPIIGRLWQGYARQSLDQLEALMLAA